MKRKTNFLLLLGPSGVGKNTLIQHLPKLDVRFIYISPLTTRTARPGETDKIYVDDATLDHLEAQGGLIAVNHVYEARYGTPRQPILDALARCQFPVLDWPVQHVATMRQLFPQQLCCVYVEPPNLQSLHHRLRDGARDPHNLRYVSAVAELKQLHRGNFDHLLDGRVINADGDSEVTARRIHLIYLSALVGRSGQEKP